MAELSVREVDKPTKKSLWYWILVISMSPIAILLLIFMALGSLLQFLFKASLLFIIVAINTPFAIMINVSIMVFDYYFQKHSDRLRKLGVYFWKSGAWFQESSNDPQWNWSDPRASVGIEIQILVSDFFKTVAAELLVVISAGIITFYTAPLRVFYISMAISLVAILHKWLNTDCLSKTALSCLCDGYGLNPMMFLYSFIGLFNIGCHPVAKCSFVASRAFLFIKYGSNVLFIFEEDVDNQINDENVTNSEENSIQVTKEDGTRETRRAFHRMKPYQKYDPNLEEPKVVSTSISMGSLEASLEKSTRQNIISGYGHAMPEMSTYQKYDPNLDKTCNVKEIVSSGKTKISTIGRDNQFHQKAGPYLFNRALPASLKITNPEVTVSIPFHEWNAFDRGLFQLRARIDFIKRNNGKYILKSFMVLKLLGEFLCEYPVERLELPEDYSKANELYHFLHTLSNNDGFATDKMRGRYEHSLTLSEIVEEVEKNVGYRIVEPMDKTFVVA